MDRQIGPIDDFIPSVYYRSFPLYVRLPMKGTLINSSTNTRVNMSQSIRLAASGWLIKGIDEVLQTHRQTDAQTNRQTDVQTNRQTETQWRWKTLGSNKMQERVKGWNVTSFMRIFSRWHATLHHGLSDCPSVGPSVHLSVFPCIGPSLRLSVHHNFELRVI